MKKIFYFILFFSILFNLSLLSYSFQNREKNIFYIKNIENFHTPNIMEDSISKQIPNSSHLIELEKDSSKFIFFFFYYNPTFYSNLTNNHLLSKNGMQNNKKNFRSFKFRKLKYIYTVVSFVFGSHKLYSCFSFNSKFYPST